MPRFASSGGDRLREASSVSVSREREPETEPERHPGPPAAAVHHPLAVQHHAHEGKPERVGASLMGQDRRKHLWFVGAGERKPAQQNTPAGAVLTAALRTAVTPGETERTERVEERGGAEETRG